MVKIEQQTSVTIYEYSNLKSIHNDAWNFLKAFFYSYYSRSLIDIILVLFFDCLHSTVYTNISHRV